MRLHFLRQRRPLGRCEGIRAGAAPGCRTAPRAGSKRRRCTGPASRPRAASTAAAVPHEFLLHGRIAHQECHRAARTQHAQIVREGFARVQVTLGQGVFLQIPRQRLRQRQQARSVPDRGAARRANWRPSACTAPHARLTVHITIEVAGSRPRLPGRRRSVPRHPRAALRTSCANTTSYPPARTDGEHVVWRSPVRGLARHSEAQRQRRQRVLDGEPRLIRRGPGVRGQHRGGGLAIDVDVPLHRRAGCPVRERPPGCTRPSVAAGQESRGALGSRVQHARQ